MSAHILLIEDEPRIADFLIRGLGEEGFGVEHAADGRHGWIQLQRGEWGDQYDGQSNTLEVHVKELRGSIRRRPVAGSSRQ